MRFRRENLEILCLNLFAFSSFCFHKMVNVILAGFVLYAIFRFKEIRKYENMDKILVILGLYVSYVIISALYFSLKFPETSNLQIKSIYWWTAPCLFLVISWMIRGRQEVITSMFVFAFLGFLAKNAISADYSLFEVWIPRRHGFGFPANITSFFCVVFLAGAYIFRKNILAKKLYVLVCYVVCVPLTFYVFTVTQSRGMFLVVALSLCFYFLFKLKGVYRDGYKKFIFSYGLVLTVFIALYFTQFNKVKERFLTESVSVEKLMHSTMDEVPYDSIGARIHLIDYALKLFIEKPFFGWGPGTSSTQYLIKKNVIPLSDYKSNSLSYFSHLHNLYVEILVRFGLIGFTFCVFILYYFVKLFLKSCDNKEVKYYFIFFVLINISFNLYEFRFTHQDYRFAMIFFSGLLFEKVLINSFNCKFFEVSE